MKADASTIYPSDDIWNNENNNWYYQNC